jgi:hypothetical protein
MTTTVDHEVLSPTEGRLQTSPVNQTKHMEYAEYELDHYCPLRCN